MSEKIVFSGITSFRNHGVEALVVSAIEQLRERLPQATITVLDRDPEFDSSRLPAGEVKFMQDGDVVSSGPMEGKGLKRSAPLPPVPPFQAYPQRPPTLYFGVLPGSAGSFFYPSRAVRKWCRASGSICRDLSAPP